MELPRQRTPFNPRKTASELRVIQRISPEKSESITSELAIANDLNVTLTTGTDKNCSACTRCMGQTFVLLQELRCPQSVVTAVTNVLSNPESAKALSDKIGEERLNELLDGMNSGDPIQKRSTFESLVGVIEKG